MTLQEIKDAITQGKTVHWSNGAYTVIQDKNGEYLIKCGNNCIGLTWSDGVTLNGKEEDFFTVNDVVHGFNVGDKVSFPYGYNAFPFAVIDANKTGVIEEINNEYISVKLDEHHDGFEDWDNCIHVHLYDDVDPDDYIRKIQE